MNRKNEKAERSKKSHNREKKTTKGALIKGMSKKLPYEIIDNPLFKRGLKKIMRRYSGIYALYRKDRLYYVGLTRDLFGRIKSHLDDRHRAKWDHFVIFRIKRVDYLKDIETLITHLVSIPGNRAKGKVPRDADITRILRNVYQQYRKGTRKILEALKK